MNAKVGVFYIVFTYHTYHEGDICEESLKEFIPNEKREFDLRMKK